VISARPIAVAISLAIFGLSCGPPESDVKVPGAPPVKTAAPVASVVAPPAAPPVSRDAAIIEATIADLSAALAAGRTTSVELVDAYLARIEAVDRHGPELRAMIELNPEARSIAEALDRERKDRGVRGPLHGVPIVIKDNIGTADQMETTAGSLALVGARPRKDSHVVARLRAAGVVILGKTNLSEWANFRSSRATSGWSGRGGQTKNAYVLDRTPCGSSSGSGTAVAASLAAGAIGTETDGSILCPSSMSALVGMKPTIGLVSRSGIIPIAASQDTAGPMTRTVRDAALLLNALADEDPSDPRTAESKGKRAADYTKTLSDDGLRGARIGVARKAFPQHPEVVANIEAAIAVMKERGAIIVDPVDVPSGGFDKEDDLLLFEFKAGMEAYLADLGPATKLRTVADLIAWNEANKEREMPFFGQEMFVRAAAKGPLTSDVYVKLKADLQRRAKAAIDGPIAKHHLDALIAPSCGPPWVIDLVNGDAFTGASSTIPAVAGYPNVNVPSGFVRELPVGVSFFGAAYSEATLLRLAYAYEQASHARKPPRFLVHAP
jgi:amidase